MLKIILYAYMSDILSCRKIERQVQRGIHYFWLAAQECPDFAIINSFRNRVKSDINNIFTQFMLLLAECALPLMCNLLTVLRSRLNPTSIHLPLVAVADSCYGSEENYRFMDRLALRLTSNATASTLNSVRATDPFR